MDWAIHLSQLWRKPAGIFLRIRSDIYNILIVLSNEYHNTLFNALDIYITIFKICIFLIFVLIIVQNICCCQQPKTNRNNNYDPDIKSDIYLVPKNVLRNAISYKEKSISVAGSCTFSAGLGNLRQPIQVFAEGKKESCTSWNWMLGWMWKPRTGSSSVPVTDVKMLDNDKPCLLPPEKKLQHTFIFAANIVHRQTLVG